MPLQNVMLQFVPVRGKKLRMKISDLKRILKTSTIGWLVVWSLVLACIAIFFNIFEELTEDVGGDADLLKLDNQILDFAISHRTPKLSAAAVDITGLGSTVIITCLVLFLILFFSSRRHWVDALQIGIAGLSAGILSPLFKTLAARERPPLAVRLVEVDHFSYPSGHSLTAAIVYLTIGFIFFERYKNQRERILCMGTAMMLVAAIGASRVYLGVHYPSDVLGGVTLGTSVALMIFAIRRAYQRSTRVSNHD